MTPKTLPKAVGWGYPLTIETAAGTYSCMGNCVRDEIPALLQRVATRVLFGAAHEVAIIPATTNPGKPADRHHFVIYVRVIGDVYEAATGGAVPVEIPGTEITARDDGRPSLYPSRSDAQLIVDDLVRYGGKRATVEALGKAFVVRVWRD